MDLPRNPGQKPSVSLARRARPSTGRSGRDRKSTRLNSSHSQISYAVFCLKKKKDGIVSSVNTDLDRLRERARALPCLVGRDLVKEVTVVFFFNDTATTEIYTLSLHDALPILGKLTDGSAEKSRAETVG